MKKLLSLIAILWLVVLAGCANNNEELILLKEQNALLQKQINEATLESRKPDRARLIVSWIWGSLSRDTAAIGDIYYDETKESSPINSSEVANEYINLWFNWWWYSLIAGCNEWYEMISCLPFSESDSVVFSEYWGCYLSNEDPDLMRTSMIVECEKQ